MKIMLDVEWIRVPSYSDRTVHRFLYEGTRIMLGIWSGKEFGVVTGVQVGVQGAAL